MFKYYVSAFWGRGGLIHNADTADALEGGGVAKPKYSHIHTLKEKGGRVKTLSKYCWKMGKVKR